MRYCVRFGVWGLGHALDPSLRRRGSAEWGSGFGIWDLVQRLARHPGILNPMGAFRDVHRGSMKEGNAI